MVRSAGTIAFPEEGSSRRGSSRRCLWRCSRCDDPGSVAATETTALSIRKRARCAGAGAPPVDVADTIVQDASGVAGNRLAQHIGFKTRRVRAVVWDVRHVEVCDDYIGLATRSQISALFAPIQLGAEPCRRSPHGAVLGIGCAKGISGRVPAAPQAHWRAL